ncbi:hypothetical protein ACQ4WP_24415 [Janthinobacterium sp. GB4P2]|uniref:hypothetical protein n=1 Tax=Janthinobacterium sp. GB4P2 TaxID=3424189 RepID=UPI003F214EB6
MSGHRRAALALHALEDADRALILGQLEPHDQHRLEAHLRELHELGFQRGGDAAEVMQSAAASKEESGDRLASASAQQMFALLRHEPAALVARVISLQEWRWSADLLTLFDALRRQQIATLQAQFSTAAPELDRALLEQLQQQLRMWENDERTKPPSAKPVGLLQRICPWIR